MRVMALDYGSKTVGVAISDPLGITAQPVETIHRDNEVSIKKSIARIKELVSMHDISVIVLGYPKNFNNTEGERCKKTIEFKERIERNIKKVDVVLWDERLSTKGALRVLTDLSRKEKDEVIDKMAATLILQGFMQANPAVFDKK
ncbi:MAG: Holliday junction resolvase RuvX [Defluviitaleaceae bacterium]|nr:Holliday junction resolvase RuvX [Defluviitaleaceae bacterium]